MEAHLIPNWARRNHSEQITKDCWHSISAKIPLPFLERPVALLDASVYQQLTLCSHPEQVYSLTWMTILQLFKARDCVHPKYSLTRLNITGSFKKTFYNVVFIFILLISSGIRLFMSEMYSRLCLLWIPKNKLLVSSYSSECSLLPTGLETFYGKGLLDMLAKTFTELECILM